MDRTVELLAWESAQRFPFTRKAALDAGWTPVEIAARIRSGRWRRLVRGCYVLREVWDQLAGDDRHLCLVAGRLLQLKPEWHVAQGSAVLLHCLPHLGKAPAKPQLVCPPSSLLSKATSPHERLAALPRQDRAVVRGLRVTSLARTAVDRARSRPLREGVVIADGVLARGVARDELQEVLARCERWPGARRAAEVVALADGRSESVLESISRAGFHQAGLPAPEPQVEVWVDQDFVARVDFLWEGAHTIGEADGRTKYASVDDLLAEKRRELQLRELGFEVVRWDWDDAFRHGTLLAEKTRRALARGARLTIDPAVRFVRTAGRWAA